MVMGWGCRYPQFCLLSPGRRTLQGTGKHSLGTRTAVSRAVALCDLPDPALSSPKVEPDRSHTRLDLEQEPCLTASADP